MPPFANFIGGSYQGSSLQSDAERSLNYYPEQVASAGGAEKSPMILVQKPGLAPFATLPASSVRCECELNGRGFAIAQLGASCQFFEILPNGSSRLYGNLPGDRRPQMCASEIEILILAGGLGYVFDLAASTLTLITAAGFPDGATKLGYLDGYFVALEPNSQAFGISGLNAGLKWDPLDFGDVEGEPGYIVTFVVDHRQIWFLGNTHGEIYYNSGAALFPITRLEGAFMEQGACGADAAFPCDNTVFWIGGNRDGQGIV